MIETQAAIFQTFISSLLSILQWPTFGFLFLGVVIGFWVGVLPGIGGATGLALMLPFIFTMDPLTAFAFLLGMHSVTQTTGDITSVLFAVPGEASTAATVLDGFPLARQGQAERALGIALFSSLIGSVVGAFALAASVPFARTLVLKIGPPETFMLTLLGLTFISALSEGSTSKGLLMAGLGLLLSTVGQDQGTALLRYTFGEIHLFDGVPLLPAVVGLFAIPPIIEMMGTRTSVAQELPPSGTGWLRGVVDTLHHWRATIRSSLIGVLFGMIPGLSASAAQWVAYAQAYQTSKQKYLFGKGSVEGLVAATAVNNAKEGAGLIPTLGFGIPGSASMAILLGAFLITGITPGPQMLTTHLNLTFAMVWAIVVSNVITVAGCFLLIKPLARITFVRASLLVPPLVILISLGAYTARNTLFDLVLMLLFGLFAWAATRSRWPLAPLLLGLVLGRSAERNLFISYSFFGWHWFYRPAVMVLTAIIIGAVLWPRIAARRRLVDLNSVTTPP